MYLTTARQIWADNVSQSPAELLASCDPKLRTIVGARRIAAEYMEANRKFYTALPGAFAEVEDIQLAMQLVLTAEIMDGLKSLIAVDAEYVDDDDDDNDDPSDAGRGSYDDGADGPY